MTEENAGGDEDGGGRDSETIEMSKVCDNTYSGIGDIKRQRQLQRKHWKEKKDMRDNGDGSFGK